MLTPFLFFSSYQTPFPSDVDGLYKVPCTAAIPFEPLWAFIVSSDTASRTFRSHSSIYLLRCEFIVSNVWAASYCTHTHTIPFKNLIPWVELKNEPNSNHPIFFKTWIRTIRLSCFRWGLEYIQMEILGLSKKDTSVSWSGVRYADLYLLGHPWILG